MRSYITGALLLALSLHSPGGAAAQVVREGDVAVFAFGRSQPTVVCAEMRLCYLELQAGEEVRGAPLVADAQTWSVAVYSFGDGESRRSEVAVKPLLCGVSTNMVVPTTRRRYELSLLSAPCRAVDDWDHSAVYTRRVRFYYPDDAEWKEAQEQAAQAAAPAPREGGASVPLADGVPVESLRFDYRWERKNGFPWEPLQVFDDGVHTYIRVPEHARQFAQPILYAVEASGARLVLNYSRPEPDAAGPGGALFFKTDRIVAHLALVIGSERRGGTPQVLHIYNRRLAGR